MQLVKVGGRIKGIPQTESLHVVERFTLIDADTIEVRWDNGQVERWGVRFEHWGRLLISRPDGTESEFHRRRESHRAVSAKTNES